MKIIVLDPLSMAAGDAILMQKHSKTVSAMHNGMRYCKAQFFPYPEQSMEDWEVKYIAIKGANGDR